MLHIWNAAADLDGLSTDGVTKIQVILAFSGTFTYLVRTTRPLGLALGRSFHPAVCCLRPCCLLCHCSTVYYPDPSPSRQTSTDILYPTLYSSAHPVPLSCPPPHSFKKTARCCRGCRGRTRLSPNPLDRIVSSIHTRSTHLLLARVRKGQKKDKRF